MQRNTFWLLTGGRRIACEVLLILVLSLFLSLVYNAVSPTGIRVLPKKVSREKQESGGGKQHRTSHEGKHATRMEANTFDFDRS